MDIRNIPKDKLIDIYCKEVGLNKEFISYNDAINYFLHVRPFTVRRFGSVATN